MRDAYNITNQFLLTLLIAFGIIALAASLAMAVLVGVTTSIFASGLREGFTEYPQAASRLNGDVSVSRERTVSDRRVMAILNRQPQTQQVRADARRPVAVAGLAGPVDGVAQRRSQRAGSRRSNSALGLGW